MRQTSSSNSSVSVVVRDGQLDARPGAIAGLRADGRQVLADGADLPKAIRYELFRAEVFAGKRAPQVMGKPPAWIGPLIEALRHDGSGDYAAAAALRERAMDEAEPSACTVDGVACEWFADGDSRLGPVCEIIANGQYFWLPLESCQGVSLEPPADLRDLVWASGEVLLPNEGRVPVLVPARYPARPKPRATMQIC
jgi:type VI secretion system protein ImpE